MRAFLLAAGLGERLRPLTLVKPKALMPVANKPLVTRILDFLSCYGIEETYMNLHFKPDDVKDLLGNGNWWNTQIHYSYEPELLGTAGAIRKLRKFLEGDKFLIVNTDIVLDLDIAGAIEFHEKIGAKATLVMVKPAKYPGYEQIGVSSDGRILINKTPGDDVSAGVYTGIGIFEPSVLEMIPSGYSRLLESVLIPLAKEGTIYTYFVDGYWADIGSIERYMQANKDIIGSKAHIPIDSHMLSDSLWIHKTAQISLTVEIEEPALIGKGVSIDDGAKIGPYTVIGDNCFVGKGASISNSILWDKCTIGEGATINNSIITGSQTISPHQRVNRSIVYGNMSEPIFDIN